MGKTGIPLVFPTRANIVELNLRHINETGGEYLGVDNLRNSNSLEWVLDAIQYPLFDRYPTIEEKAATLTWIIITDHVFFDGCKRTGMSALEIFLKLNGFQLESSTDEIVNVALRIAKRQPDEKFSREEFVEWVKSKMKPLKK